MAKNPNNRRRVKARRTNLEVGNLKIMVKGFVVRVVSGFEGRKEMIENGSVGERRRVEKWVFEGFYDCCRKGAN